MLVPNDRSEALDPTPSSPEALLRNSAHTLGFSMPRSSASKRTDTSVLKSRALAANSSRYCRSKASGSAGLMPPKLTEHLLRSWDVEPPPRTVVRLLLRLTTPTS